LNKSIVRGSNLLMDKHTQDEVNKILIDIDPVGLIQGGAPDDEYKAEAGQIMSILQSPYTVDSLTEGIHKLFTKAFGESTIINKDKFREIAEELEK
jgi:hypothetical protein